MGCEAYILRDDKLLLGLRAGKIYGAGTWALPGGHLEFGERADECITRELQEEMDIKVATTELRLLAVTNDIAEDSTGQYIHLTFKTEVGQQEPKVSEPEICEAWKWFHIGELPENVFLPHQKILETIKSGEIYIPRR